MPKREEETKPKTAKSPGASYGFWGFARDFSSGVFSLLNSGKVFPAFGLLLLVLMGLIAWRVPDTELAGLIREFFQLLRSSFGFAMGALIVTNVGWLWLIRRQREIYQSEITRLSDLRSKLLLGDKSSDFTPIKELHTSNGTQRESYVMPDSVTPSKRKK
ncbi:hypothetical protein [Rubrivivax rivuli]|uniref:Uncharacterized protein n=1 Tax=Rubrivivax rivuli TaxID=1862385 RepID=A0A437RJU9_9BURK|nr:hypothetical protein [Rubrivivax rivuli]RVU47054.1 hypothetical protein EOE66_04610 [Rubrivivax rivuli]